MKKILVFGGASLPVLGAFAETGAGTVDFSAATTALTSTSTALTSWVSTAIPYLVSIASAFLVFWLGKMIFRLVKGWASTAK